MELDILPETRAILERSLFFHPLPFVERVVFIATPHRGSFFAKRRLGRFASRLVTLPGELADSLGDLLLQNDADRVLLRSLDDVPSSIDNMKPDTPFLQTLAALEVAPDVHAHSIIAVLPGQEDIESGHDGVVSFESAHLDGVDSELVVRSGHSTQSHPLTIAEIRRILLEAIPSLERDTPAGAAP